MVAKILDGKKFAKKLRYRLKEKISGMDPKPGLGVILVGNSPASELYIKMKERACKEVGIYFKKIVLAEGVSQTRLLEEIEDLNQNKNIHGILVQLPLPKHINENFVIESINPKKDVDGFTPVNMGNLLIGKNQIVPATPKGIIKLIEKTDIELKGKDAVVIGRSNIVGKPIFVLLQQKGCTVTLCHSKTKSLDKYTKKADILVVAKKKKKMIGKDMIKEGAIIIDVGINKIDDKIVGDVDFDEVKEKAGFITPVPGGVGPMTIASLLENTLGCMKLQKMREES